MGYRNYALLKSIETPNVIKNRLTKNQLNTLKIQFNKGKSISDLSNKFNKNEEIIQKYIDEDVIYTSEIIENLKNSDESKIELLKDIKSENNLSKNVRKNLADNLVRKELSVQYLSNYKNEILNDIVNNSGNSIRNIQKSLWNNEYIYYNSKKNIYDNLSDFLNNGILYYTLILKTQKSYKRKQYSVNKKKQKRKQVGSVAIEITISYLKCYNMNDKFMLKQMIFEINSWLGDLGIIHLVNSGNGFTINDARISDEYYTDYTKNPFNYTEPSATTIIASDGKTRDYHKMFRIDLIDQLSDIIKTNYLG